MTSKGFVEVTDLLGTGANGLLYTDQGGAWRFRELFTSGPLDLLVSIDNGIGGTTRISHSTSAAHWARALAAGRPWRTAMPVAQRVVDRIATSDQVTGTVLQVTYQYAHGVYDSEEREFRGFARVTELDREAPADDPQPIAQTRLVRWYHTGANIDLRDEWFPVPGAPLEDQIPGHAWARRAVRGMVRREETYALDGERRPYLVSEKAYRVYPVGRLSADLRSAWTPLPIRSRTTALERTSDVRQVEVSTTYDLDDNPGGYGLPVEIREIGRGRAGTFSTEHEQQQTKTLERYTRTTYVNLDEMDEPELSIDLSHTPRYVVGKTSVEERFGATGSGEVLLAKSRWFYDGAIYQGLGYPGSGTSPGVTKGLLSCRLDMAFMSDGFTAAYPSSSRALSARDERGHYLTENAEHYLHALRIAYTDHGLPSGSLDPNGNETKVTYDPAHNLFPVRVIDPLANPTVLERAVLPFQLAAIVDANDNRTEFTYDPTTLPATKSVMGKFVAGAWQGDPPAHPTEVYTYDLESLPIGITIQTRQIREGATFDVHRYVDGMGRIVQERQTAEPDPASATEPRFRVTGWKLYNHKGLVVRAYQPTFSNDAAYQPASTNVASIETIHDPLGRAIRVNHPDETFETADYQVWVHARRDRNDNAGALSSADPRYGAHLATFRHHIDTPTRVYLDPLGREIATSEDNGAGNLHVTRSVFDLKDQLLEVWDARRPSHPTWTFDYDLAGRRTKSDHTTGVGTRWTLADAAGNPIWKRDARLTEVERTFDALNRPLQEISDDGTTRKLRRQWRYVGVRSVRHDGEECEPVRAS